MNWLIVVAGAGLALVGALAIYAGLDLAQVERGIQVERGWVMVVAGATFVAGGVVTLAIGRLLFRLEALGRNFRAGPMARPDESKLNVQPKPTPARQGSGFAAPAITAGAAVAAGAAMLAAHGAHADEARDLAEREADRMQDEAQDDAGDAQRAASVPVAVEAVAFDPPVDMAAESAGTFVAHGHPATPQLSDFDDDWLDRALSGEADGPMAEVANWPAKPEPGHEPVVHDKTAHATQEPGIAGEMAHPAHDAAVAEAPVPHEDSAPAKIVVGRYQAAGVAYMMYQDGSIDADDGARLRQFASMSDLKAHISNPE